MIDETVTQRPTETVLDFECFNINDIVTPINVDILQDMLHNANYDPDNTSYLTQGFRNGFDLGYRGPEQRIDLSANIPLRVGDPVDRWNKIMKEVELGRYAGPSAKFYTSTMYNRLLDLYRRLAIRPD